MTITCNNTTFDDIGAFCREKFDPERKKQPLPPTADDAFVVMDERTLRDKTAILVRWEYSNEHIDPNP